MINSNVLVEKLETLKSERDNAVVSNEDIEIVEKKVAEFKAKLMDELNANVEQRKALLNSQISLLEELLQHDEKEEDIVKETSPQYL